VSLNRREFLVSAGALAAAGAVLPAAACGGREQGNGAWRRPRRRRGDEWAQIQADFAIDPAYIHLAGLLIASHPRPVAEAIAEHRSGIDRNPALYLDENRRDLERATREAAADYLGAAARDVALTDSTTMAIALVYNGLAVRAGQEMLVSRHDYYSTREALRYRAGRSGAVIREVQLFADSAGASQDEIVSNVLGQITPRTRVLATTWVHSSTGLKIPLRSIADELRRVNAGRAPAERVLLCVDGVHALGVEDFTLPDLGCDFFMAGTHKWLFGPRGTGILWGNPATQDALSSTIPTFSRDGSWGGLMTPGGFKPFEHQWALAEAFRFHQEIGKHQVQERIHDLATQAKEGLRQIERVRLHTPMDPRLSAGIVCFDVDGMSPRQVVRRLEERGIIASVTPYTPTNARVTPGLLNTTDEIEYLVRVVAEL
jgi:isopenicillin-N epimerase